MHVSLVFLHMFFGPAWFCIEPRSTILHVLLFSKRTCHNVHSQKVKPCSRTTRFSAGLHCQAQKGRRTEPDWGGGGGGGVLNVSHFLSVLYEVMIEKGQKNAPRKSHLFFMGSKMDKYKKGKNKTAPPPL